MKKKSILTYFLICLFLLVSLSPMKVSAENRSVTIGAPNQAAVGQKFTVTLGFNPKALTKNFDFTLAFDSAVVKYTGVFKNLTGSSKYEVSVNSPGVGRLRAGSGVSYNPLLDGEMVAQAVSLQFEVVAAGSVNFKIINAADGFKSNVINWNVSKTVTLTDKPATTTTTTTTTTTASTTRTTTTRTTTTRPTTTTTTRTTTSREKTSTTTTTPTTSTVTSIISTTPITTDPGVVFTAKRYDAANLTIPESVPSEQNIPESFEAVDINHLGTEMTAYRSSTLPYTLFWLADDQGDERFYYYDEEASSYIPFFRTEWSSRYFTFAVLSEKQLPDGFELKTMEIRGQMVPVYTPSKGYYITHKSFHELMQKVNGEMPIPDWKNYEGEIDPSDTTTPKDTTLPFQSESNTNSVVSGENNPTDTSPVTPPVSVSKESDSLTWQGVTVEIPEDLNLVALRMNDSDKKALYFYDRTLDSLIRADLWLVPLAGSFLNPRAPIVPEETPVSTARTEPSASSEAVSQKDQARPFTLFGFTAPLWMWIAMGIAVIALLTIIIWFVLRLRKARSYDPDFDISDGDHVTDMWDDYEQTDDDHVTSREEAWKRLGIVDIASTTPTSKDEQTVPKLDVSDTMESENVSGSVSDPVVPIASDHDIAREEKVISGDAVISSQLDGEWARLEKVIESSSERRRHMLNDENDLVHDEASDSKFGESSEESLWSPKLDKDSDIIQPEMNRPTPKHRISKKRLRGFEKTKWDDDPFDKDEL